MGIFGVVPAAWLFEPVPLASSSYSRRLGALAPVLDGIVKTYVVVGGGSPIRRWGLEGPCKNYNIFCNNSSSAGLDELDLLA